MTEIIAEPQVLIATHPSGSQTLVTIWPDGGGEVAFRCDPSHTWSAPTPLTDAP